jgi:hypothetical protein
MEKRRCLECDEAFTGRIDKKFCSDQCRNTYNNRLNSDESNQIRNTNRILKKNWRILNDLNPSGKASATREKLLRLGFQFSYVTGYYQTKKGDVYYYCYDQGYIQTGENYYSLVHRKDYAD